MCKQQEEYIIRMSVAIGEEEEIKRKAGKTSFTSSQ